MEAMISNLFIESRQSVVAKPKWAVSILNPSEPSSGEIAPIVSGQYFFVATQRGGIFLVGQSPRAAFLPRPARILSGHN
jgi:hypothetical protein